jgi:hypothetical protein
MIKYFSFTSDFNLKIRTVPMPANETVVEIVEVMLNNLVKHDLQNFSLQKENVLFYCHIPTFYKVFVSKIETQYEKENIPWFINNSLCL